MFAADPLFLAAHREHERPLAVHPRERADAVRGQELVLVQHVPKHQLDPLARWGGQEPMPTVGLGPRDVLREVGRFSRNQRMRLVKPGSRSRVSSSRIVHARRDISPTSERMRSGSMRPVDRKHERPFWLT
jgi:hypothetical protein